MNGKQRMVSVKVLLCGAALLGSALQTGCQITEAGQTLPSANHVMDDVQYFAPDTEFKLSRVAAAQMAGKADAALQDP